MNILRNKSFTFVWIGNATSELGGAFGTFCNSLLIYELTGSTLALSSMWLLYFLPSLLLQLVIGPFIDRWSRKWTMVMALWSRGIIFLIPLIAYLTGHLEPWHIFTVQLMVGLITPLYVPANQAILPTIVDETQLQTANAYIDGTVRLMTFLAPVTAGIIVQYIGISITFIMICCLLFISGLLLIGVQENRTNKHIRQTWLKQFSEGMHYFLQLRVIIWLGVFLAIVQFAVGVTMVINLPYITGELAGNYATYGYFMASFPLGYVVGSMFVGKIKYHSQRMLMLGALALGGLTFIALGFINFIVFAIITEAIGGIAMAIFNIHNTTICQKSVPQHVMGKVFSLRLVIIRGTLPIGVLVGGSLSELWGVRMLCMIIGCIICMSAILGMLLPYFSFMDQKSEVNELSSKEKAL